MAADFDITNTSVPDYIDSVGTTDVTFEITNNGGTSGDASVAFIIDNTTLASDTISSVGSGSTVSVTLTGDTSNYSYGYVNAGITVGDGTTIQGSYSWSPLATKWPDVPRTSNIDLPLVPPLGDANDDEYRDQWGDILNIESWSPIDTKLNRLTNDAHFGRQNDAIVVDESESSLLILGDGDTTLSNIVSIGANSNTTGANSVAIGSSAGATASSTVSIGRISDAETQFATAIGTATLASGDSSTAAGFGAEATDTNTTAIGSGASASGPSAVSLGVGADAKNSSTTAVGDDAQATETRATAIGRGAYATSSSSTALGDSAEARNDNALALGNLTFATTTRSTALGSRAESRGVNSTAIGEETFSYDDNTVTIGAGHDIALGDSNRLTLPRRTDTPRNPQPGNVWFREDLDELRMANTNGEVEVIQTSTVTGVMTIHTKDATNVGGGTADLNGLLPNTGQYAGANVYFEWGEVSTLPNLPNETAAEAQGVTGSFTKTIGNLLSNTTYAFRAMGDNSGGTFEGEIHTFST